MRFLYILVLTVVFQYGLDTFLPGYCTPSFFCKLVGLLLLRGKNVEQKDYLYV